MKQAFISGLALLCMVIGTAQSVRAEDTATCEGKRSWQRRIVDTMIHQWLADKPDPQALLELLQAEQGLAACRQAASGGTPLHTTRLPINLSLPQVGAVLLANELEWRGLVPPPAEALEGKFFRVSPERPRRRRPVPTTESLPPAQPRTPAGSAPSTEARPTQPDVGSRPR